MSLIRSIVRLLGYVAFIGLSILYIVKAEDTHFFLCVIILCLFDIETRLADMKGTRP